MLGSSRMRFTSSGSRRGAAANVSSAMWAEGLSVIGALLGGVLHGPEVLGPEVDGDIELELARGGAEVVAAEHAGGDYRRVLLRGELQEPRARLGGAAVHAAERPAAAVVQGRVVDLHGDAGLLGGVAQRGECSVA